MKKIKAESSDEQALAVHAHRGMLLLGHAAHLAPLPNYCLCISQLSMFQTAHGV